MKQRTVSLALCALTFFSILHYTFASPHNEPVGLSAAIDLEATLPMIRSGVAVRQQGSWDRTGGNGDFNNFVNEQPDGTVVLFDEKGPGCVYRIWMTGINNNELKFYFDDETAPRINTRLQDFFNQKQFFPRPLLLNNDESSGGWTTYVPIPFARRLRIVSNRKGVQHFYYNITFHEYFDRRSVDSLAAPQSSANEIPVWNELGGPEEEKQDHIVGLKDAIVAPGETAELLRLKNAYIVRRVRFDNLPEDPSFLRDLVLRVYYDGQTFPSVECPLGDFVGSPFNWSRVSSLMFHVVPEKRRIVSRWPMPFQNGIRITLTNEGKAAVPFQYLCLFRTYDRDHRREDTRYFHAQFRLVRTGARDGKDLIFLDRKGRGHYVGTVQSVEGSRGLYFLEGDERVFIDDDRDIPSLYGTGTEDYYNGGWYFDRGPFSTFTHGAPIRQNNGVISMYRLHLTDVLPFDKRILFGVEHGHGNEAAEKYGLVAFWYEDELRPIDSRLGTADERRFSGKITRPLKREPGMMEAHTLRVIEKSPSLEHERQGMSGFGAGWLGDDQLWISRAARGERIVLELPVQSAGKYAVLANFTKARDYGIWRISLDGKVVKELDLYNPEVVPTGNVELGTLELAAGAHRLTLECIGTNAASVGVKYMGGLDYLWLKPAQ